MVDAKKELGVWFPPEEKHLTDMLHKSKVGLVDGKGTYQLHKLRKAIEYVPDGHFRTCLDVGAHVGLWSMHLCRMFDFVYGFEPVPLLRKLYNHNLIDSRNWHIYPFALSDKAETLTLDYRSHDTGNTHVLPTRADAPQPEGEPVLIEAHAVPLDKLSFDHVDFIKIDVEGWELPVVVGAKETLLKHRPVIIIEQKGNGEKWYGHSDHAAVRFLEGLGMKKVDELAGDCIMIWSRH